MQCSAGRRPALHCIPQLPQHTTDVVSLLTGLDKRNQKVLGKEMV